MLSYKISAEDAETMAETFAPNVSASDLTGLGAFQGIMTESINNQITNPFSINVQKYWEMDTGINPNKERSNMIKELSRYKYGRPENLVSEEILSRFRV